MRYVAAVALVLILLEASVLDAVDVRPVVVSVTADRFEISGDGNSATGVRRAPVPYSELSELYAAVVREAPMPTAVRLVRSAPPQVIDYVFCVTEDGTLVVGQQVRALSESGRYEFSQGAIKRAYVATEAGGPWTWIIDIPLGREVDLSLEVRAVASGWPLRAVTVTPRVDR
jgi:hypothetical protein